MRRLPFLLAAALAIACSCARPSAARAEPAGPVTLPPIVKPPAEVPAAGAHQPGAPEQSGAPASQVVVVNSGPTIEELKHEAPGLLQQGIGGFLGALAQGLGDVLNVAAGFNFVTQTPPGLSYDHPDVRRLWSAARAAANAALALIALVGGYNVMLRRHLAVRYDGAFELLPRLLVGAILANTSMWWAKALIDLNNALCQSVGAGLPDWRRFLIPLAAAELWTPALVVLALAVLLFLVLCLLLVLQMLMRLVLVDTLLILAPLALLCWILPQTQRWARLWSTTFVGAVLTQFVQVVALLLAVNLPTAAAGGAGIAGGALGPFMGLAALILVLKLPAIVGHQLSDGWGVLRGVAIGQATRMLAPTGGGGRGGGGATARAAGGSSAGRSGGS